MTDERRQGNDHERLIEVFRAKDAAEAHLLSGVLDEAAIPNRIDGESLQGVIGELPPGWMNAPRILVLENRARDARAIIEGLERARQPQ